MSYQEDLHDFLTYIHSPWRIFWANLLAGIARGVGTILGFTVVISLILYLLGFFTALPIIGEYFQTLQESLQNIPS